MHRIWRLSKYSTARVGVPLRLCNVATNVTVSACAARDKLLSLLSSWLTWWATEKTCSCAAARSLRSYQRHGHRHSHRHTTFTPRTKKVRLRLLSSRKWCLIPHHPRSRRRDTKSVNRWLHEGIARLWMNSDERHLSIIYLSALPDIYRICIVATYQHKDCEWSLAWMRASYILASYMLYDAAIYITELYPEHRSGSKTRSKKSYSNAY